MRRQSRVDSEDIALQVETGEAENYRLPNTPQPRGVRYPRRKLTLLGLVTPA